jgi:hypothetical protein
MVAAVTDLKGDITGAQRTWLNPEGFDSRRLGKAPIDTPRRAMGSLLGHAVRFGAADDVLAAGEGIETMLSLRRALPTMPMAAALSANHLAALLLPLTLRRLYIARDDDAAGDMALAALTERAEAAGIEALALSPRMGDFNEDLRAFGLAALRAALRIQLAPQDVVRFMRRATARTDGVNRWKFRAVLADPARPMPDRAAPAFKRAIGRQAGRTRNGCARLFFAGADAPLHRKAK